MNLSPWCANGLYLPNSTSGGPVHLPLGQSHVIYYYPFISRASFTELCDSYFHRLAGHEGTCYVSSRGEQEGRTNLGTRTRGLPEVLILDAARGKLNSKVDIQTIVQVR
jgi:hypothetical protein